MADEILLNDKQFLEAIKGAGLEKSLDGYTTKMSDKRVSDGIETFKKNLTKKDLTDKERLQEVEGELAKMKSNKATDDKKILVVAELKKQGLNENLLKYVKIADTDDQDQIAESVTNLKNDLLETKQADIDSKLKEGEPPSKGEATFTGSGIETEAKEFAKEISAKETSNNKE